MPYRKTQLVNGEFYHLIKRGIEGRGIFLDEEDFLRFINSLLVFNDTKHSPWESRAFWHQRSPSALTGYRPDNPLVEIHAFVLMKNHFHLLLRQLIDNGITNFTRKLGGFSCYFNKKYKRAGTLFEGRYKIIRVKDENQLRSNFVYVHTNPVGIIEPEWKDRKVKNPQKAIQFIEDKYRWTSYWDYLGKENFPTVTTREFLLELFGGEKEIENEIDSWISHKATTTLPVRVDDVDGEFMV